MKKSKTWRRLVMSVAAAALVGGGVSVSAQAAPTDTDRRPETVVSSVSAPHLNAVKDVLPEVVKGSAARLTVDPDLWPWPWPWPWPQPEPWPWPCSVCVNPREPVVIPGLITVR